MTWKILADNTQCIIHRSNICSALDPTSKYLHVDPLNKDSPIIITSLCDKHVSLDHGEGETALSLPLDNPSMAIIDPQDLAGHTFLMDEHEDGQWF